MSTMRIIIAEDQQILLDALADSLKLSGEVEVVAKTIDCAHVLALCEHCKPDLVLMDICNQDGLSGINETIKIKERFPKVKIVLMTAMPDASFVHAAKEAGADGFVYKNVSRDELLQNLRQTMQDYESFPLAKQENLQSDLDLTEREIDILRLVCKGKNRKEISEKLFLSENTVRNHINRILMKTGYDSIAQLAIFAVSKGFIVPEPDNDL